MMNIFNIFDPSTIYLNLNWMMIFIPILFFLSSLYLVKPRWMMTWISLMKFINNELNINLKKKIFNINFMTIFIIILLINFISLFSFIFTASSHMTTNLSLSLPYWSSFFILGWYLNFWNTLSHQVPFSTPNLLMPFMVMIELISNLIRPGTLSIRLTANMIAGHLILTLISNNGVNLIFIFSLILIIMQTSLMILEMSVAMIQAYVFTILLSLYSQEI